MQKQETQEMLDSRPAPDGTPTHFYSLQEGLDRRSFLRAIVGTAVFLLVLIPCGLLGIFATMSGAPEFLLGVCSLGGFGLALVATVLTGRWLFPAPVSCLLDFEGTHVRYRRPTRQDGSAFEELVFENRGLSLAGEKGQDHLLRTSEGKVLRMARNYLVHTAPQGNVLRGSGAEMVTHEAFWCFTLQDGALSLKRVELRRAVAAGLVAQI